MAGVLTSFCCNWLTLPLQADLHLHPDCGCQQIERRAAGGGGWTSKVAVTTPALNAL